MKQIFLLMLVSMGFILTGCEKESDFTQKIVNDSDHDITFQVVGDSYLALDSFTVAANSERIIHQLTTYGANEQDCVPLVDAMTITIADSLQLQKDFLLEENWSSSVNGDKYLIQVCSFAITNDDIE